MVNKMEAGSALSTSKEVKDGARKNNSIDGLSELLIDGNLTMEKIEQEAEKLGVDTYTLSCKIILKSKLSDIFLNYCKELGKLKPTGVNKEEIIRGFFEKIQQVPKQTKQTEEVPQAVEIPEIVAAPAVSPEEESQPVVTPSQKKASTVLKVPTAKTVFPKKTKEVVSQPEMKNWWEVKRETEVMAVEDLSGDLSLFERHVDRLGVAKKDISGHWNWTGKDKKVVFLGDILGDYEMDGIEITNTIFDLAKQAERVGGEMDMLCGNHDAFFINFLCRKYKKESCVEAADDFFTLFSGVWELAQYDSELKEIELKKRMEMGKLDDEKEKDEIKKYLVGLFYERIPLIIDKMKTSPEGRRILENICKIKVAVVHDDTLFCHTDPTAKMITDLTKDGDIVRRVAEVNRIFQENLRKALFAGEKFSDDFRQIDETYLYTDNRDYFTEQKSFNGLAESALVQVMEHLYESDQIKLIAEAEEEISEKGLRNFEWGDWWSFLEQDLRSAKIEVGEDALEKWKKENGIKGEYIDEIGVILSGVLALRKIKPGKERVARVDAVHNLIEKMAEKIKKSNPVDDMVKKVRNSGINAIIHGHSPYRSRPYQQYGSDKVGRYYDENGLMIVSPHASFYDEANFRDFEKGISVIKKNGEVDLMGKSFRNKRS